MTNISKHPCANKCTDFKDEQCKTCLVKEHEDLSEAEFLIGDTVVLDAHIKNFDQVYQITEVYENTVDVYIGIGILTLNKKFVRSATVAELNANRRLTDAEMALGEVS